MLEHTPPPPHHTTIPLKTCPFFIILKSKRYDKLCLLIFQHCNGVKKKKTILRLVCMYIIQTHAYTHRPCNPSPDWKTETKSPSITNISTAIVVSFQLSFSTSLINYKVFDFVYFLVFVFSSFNKRIYISIYAKHIRKNTCLVDIT